MKKLKSLEKILLILTVFAIICGMSTAVSANGDLNDLFNNADKIPTVPNDNQEQPKPEENKNTPAANNNQNTNLNTNTNVNKNTNSTTLPKTGVNDTGIWILAGTCIVIAIYTYKKVRDYNV